MGASGSAGEVLAGESVIAPAQLKALDLPERSVVQAVDFAFAPGTRALMKPGGSVSVRVEGTPPREADAFRRKVALLQDTIALMNDLRRTAPTRAAAAGLNKG